MYGNLKLFRESLGISQKEFARSLGLGQTTYNGYETGARDPKSDFWVKVAQTYHVSVDYLMGYEGAKKAPTISVEAQRVAKAFDELDEHGKRTVRVVLDEERARMMEASGKKGTVMRTIPLLQPFAAGPGEPDTGNQPERYEVPADSPADFAIQVNGSSMEPYLHDHTIALGVSRAPRDGEVGAFVVNGEFLVKQMIHDHIGNIYLVSLNRDEADKDVTLWASAADQNRVWAIGTILSDRKIPLPKV